MKDEDSMLEEMGLRECRAGDKILNILRQSHFSVAPHTLTLNNSPRNLMFARVL